MQQRDCVRLPVSFFKREEVPATILDRRMDSKYWDRRTEREGTWAPINLVAAIAALGCLLYTLYRREK
jgi:hypothetical protein